MWRALLTALVCAFGAEAYDFVRHGTEAEALLAAAAEQYRRSPQLHGAPAGPVLRREVGRLLFRHLSGGFALPDDWFVNETGSVIVFLSEPGCGALIRQFTVYSLREDGYLHLTGVYRVISRAYTWQPAETRFTGEGAGGMRLVYTGKDGTRRECSFDFSQPAGVHRIAPLHAPITPAEERGVCSP